MLNGTAYTLRIAYVPHDMPTNRCSCAFSPTDGRSTLVSIPRSFKMLGLPIPDTSRSCGDLIALSNIFSETEL
jgi:hypothetical protein